MKNLLKNKLGLTRYNRLRKYKLSTRRYWLFLTKGGLRYLTIAGVMKQLDKNRRDRRFRAAGYTGKKILWVGCFPPWHRNVGDQAQTLALELFFEEQFPDYHLITFTRQEVGSRRWEEMKAAINRDDLVLLHSTGDFGSKYIDHKPYAGGLSWSELRRDIVAQFPRNRVIQLPVSVYYGSDDAGLRAISDDRLAYSGKNFMVMCRESTSLEVLESEDICDCEFFPDFVFYLKPEASSEPRSGALLMLRGPDKESIFNDAMKHQIGQELNGVISAVEVKDIMVASFPMFPLIREKYMKELAKKYQRYSLVVTDRMHGMIMAIITDTPCIALNEAIPHKLSGYKTFLNGVVEFVDDIDEISAAAKRISTRRHKSVSLRHYFENFRDSASMGDFDNHV